MSVLAVDGGGTAVKAVIFSDDGTALGYGQAGACNFSVDPHRAVVNIKTAGGTALDRGSMTWSDVEVIAAGVSGAGRPAQQDQLSQMLAHLGHVLVADDGYIGMLGALAGEPGAAVVSGTGSIAVGRGASGCAARAGGYGYILGDEGSAFAMAVTAIAAVLRAEDGRQTKDEQLRAVVLEHYQVKTVDDLIPFVYQQPLDRGRIASLAQRLAHLAADGHERSLAIFEASGQQLGGLVTAVLRKLDLLGSPCRAAWLGGSFRSGSLLTRPLTERILSEAPRCLVGPPELPALAGAFFLARPHLDRDEQVIQRLRSSLEEISP